ncbi:serine/threonine-protein kinase [Mariprofundus ferrooxydans]|uniref:serine/threonine-protein kinase n=1 Tax=Mariprofundus ferrooxydans TaxID=314344 RepID=UPI00036A2AC4|nr:serine/threonine-protein kinase [Mariprofundus ferrooxydans]
MEGGTFWKSDWFFGVCLTLLLLLAHSFALEPVQYLDRSFYDLGARINALQADDDIVIINLDKKSLDTIGDHPQEAVAETIARLSAAGARLIALDLFYGQPDKDRDGETTPLTLPDAVRASGNTLLPIYFLTGTVNTRLNADIPDYVRRASIGHINDSEGVSNPINGTYLRAPYAKLTRSAAGLGHLNIQPDDDGIVRSEPLAILYSGHYFPSMSLSLAAGALHISMNDIRINIGRSIELGPINIPVNDRIQMLPAFHKHGFQTYSFAAVRSGAVPAESFSDKIVLIGMTGKGSGNGFATPFSTHMSTVEFNAHALQSILKEESISRPSWASMAETGLLLLIGLYLIILLPRMPVLISAAASVLLLVLITGADTLLLSSYAVWLQTMAAVLLLIIGHAGLALKHYYSTRHHTRKSNASSVDETNKMLAFSFQNQGMLDQACEKFMACPMNEEIASYMYELALSFERKRQFSKAVNIYEYISEYQADYKDIQTRIISAGNANDALSGSDDKNSGLSALLLTGENRPTLGRYEILSELGKGAMGTVFLGRDPKINRQVAIKTMALSEEFEADELEEVKSRFFHEAEIAGMLNHPNIVTIFDAGDEHDLAYIAMEFLDGIDLIPYTKKDRLLPIQTTLKIIGKVAEALQYAHNHGVIHRDIKPANIMILKNKTVKVTDFGIAHIAESTKTKAGVVLGTPSYMSPEQLSGKELDGRSDLFSLGVMLYELTSGVRPFRAESISKLMLKIAKEPHVPVQEHNPDIPDCVAALIDHLLAKKSQQRFNSASDVLEEISRCLRDMNRPGGQP